LVFLGSETHRNQFCSDSHTLRIKQIRVFGIRNTPTSVMFRFLPFPNKTDSGCFWDPKDPKHTQIRSAPFPRFYEQNGFGWFLGSEKHPNLLSSDSPFCEQNRFGGFWDPKHLKIRSAPILRIASTKDSSVFGIRHTPKSVLL
jgi:hypothetical protein